MNLQTVSEILKWLAVCTSVAAVVLYIVATNKPSHRIAIAGLITLCFFALIVFTQLAVVNPQLLNFCPNCDKEISSAYCPDCGWETDNDVAPTCPNCGSEWDTAFCGDCGSSMNKDG